MTSELTSFKSVSKMLGELKLLTRSRNTELTYLKSLKSFLKQIEVSDPDVLIERVKNKEIDVNEIYKQYVVSLASQNIAPKSVAAWAYGVRKFFSANGIEVSPVPMRIYSLHEDVLPTKEELIKVLENSSLKARVSILILLSSGLRVGELHQLKLGDIELNSDPPLIRVKALTAKERKGRITFVSPQAKKLLNEYLEMRRQTEKLNPESPLIATDDGKPMSYQNLQYILNNAFKKVAKKVGKRYSLHPHSLRKWFKTQLISAGIPGPIVDRLTGHHRYLANEYELYTEEQLRQWYLKGVDALTI
jgi:integrase/recombinase XerD